MPTFKCPERPVLQGGSKLVTDLFDAIKAFKETLSLYEEQLQNKNFELFPFMKKTVQARLANEILDLDDYIEVVRKLKKVF